MGDEKHLTAERAAQFPSHVEAVDHRQAHVHHCRERAQREPLAHARAPVRRLVHGGGRWHQAELAEEHKAIEVDGPGSNPPVLDREEVAE